MTAEMALAPFDRRADPLKNFSIQIESSHPDCQVRRVWVGKVGKPRVQLSMQPALHLGSDFLTVQKGGRAERGGKAMVGKTSKRDPHRAPCGRCEPLARDEAICTLSFPEQASCATMVQPRDSRFPRRRGIVSRSPSRDESSLRRPRSPFTVPTSSIRTRRGAVDLKLGSPRRQRLKISEQHQLGNVIKSPIQRCQSESQGTAHTGGQLLRPPYSPTHLALLMCRSTLLLVGHFGGQHCLPAAALPPSFAMLGRASSRNCHARSLST
ncbi:hypothetical protein FIBSPDRAFT_985666 [Athelia psychrophila]|uniref:Uncharacterized protein n=1 Tax=Athelia psychrophila TaxID=1759441 RepID=A0A166B6F7_9AGAM|nr:hypothetical protein FIBSPDRAFT_985666 [Fibularhizoctonia sp. CBS 109695]